MTSFYKSCEDYNRTKDYELVKKSSLELLFIVPYNFLYLENTNAFIVYVCSYVYVSKPDTRAYDIIAKITRIFIKNNSKEYSEVINQYLGALYVYGYDLRGTKIISSAGTIDSAQILQNSGIGHSLILEKANTPVIIDNKYVGKFYTHYGSFINFELKKELSPIGEPIGTTWSMAFLKLLPQYLSRSIEAIFSLEVAPNLTSIKNFMVTIFIVQPEEHGTINITRSNGEPNIVYNFYNNDKDLELIRATIEYFYNTFKDIAIMTYPNPDVITDSNKLKDFLGSYHYVNNTTTPGTYLSYHMCGSLPVGKVVTNNLRVMGIKNLYVVDNSVWPIIPDGNTEAAALMVGKLFSDYLRRKSNQCPCNR